VRAAALDSVARRGKLIELTPTRDPSVEQELFRLADTTKGPDRFHQGASDKLHPIVETEGNATYKTAPPTSKRALPSRRQIILLCGKAW
jgi:hypothetical protein